MMPRTIVRSTRPLLTGDGGYLLLVVAIGLLAAWRLGGPGLVASADGELHLYRVFALDRALEQGIFFPRVVPDLLFGYGYPLFNFYPPASTYFVELLHLLGFGFLGALGIAYGASFVVAGLAMYGCARSAFARIGGPEHGRSGRQRAAALAAAGSYVLAPYFLINVYTRGALAEALAMALFPALLLAAQRATAAGQGRGAPVALALLCALLVLTHSALAIFFLPIVAGYGLVDRRATGKTATVVAVARLLGALLLGLALSAFFWLPATLERDYVSAGNLETGFYDVQRNFLALPDLLARELRYPTTTTPPIPPRLGWPQVMVAAAAVLFLARRSALRPPLAFWAAVTVAAIFLTTPASAVVWESTPLIAGLSFPWRLLALAGLACALLAGWLVFALPSRLALPAALALVAASAVLALAGIAPERRSIAETEIDLARYWRFEFETSLVGTTSANEYLPVALRAGSYVLPRVPEEAYGGQGRGAGPGATVRLLEAEASRLRLRVTSEETASIIAHAVYFPGWRATIDGVTANPYPSTALGVVTVDVPPGEHELTLGYSESDVALAGKRIALGGLVVVLLALGIPGSAAFRETGRLRRALAARRPLPAGALLAALAVVALALLPATPRQAPDTLGPPEAAAGELCEDIALLGWSPPIDQASVLRFKLYWLARRTPLRNEVVAVTLRDGQGDERVRWERHPRYGFSPTLRWVAGEVVPDEYALALPPELAAGEYAVTVSLRGSPGAVTIGRAELGPGRAQPAPPAARPQHALNLRAGDGMRLLGYDLASSPAGRRTGAATAGEDLTVALHWQSIAVVDRDYTVFLHLVDEQGRRRAGHDAQPADGRRPTVLWQPGEILIDRHRLTVPADLPPGRYQLRVGAYARPEMARLDLFEGDGRRMGDSAAVGDVEVR